MSAQDTVALTLNALVCRRSGALATLAYNGTGIRCLVMHLNELDSVHTWQ